MPRQRHGIGNNDLIGDDAVVGYMHVGHQEIVIADDRGFTRMGCAVDRDILANLVIVSNFDQAYGAVILQVLRLNPNDCSRKDLVVSANFGMPIDHHVGTNVCLGANRDFFANHCVGSNFDRGVKGCP